MKRMRKWGSIGGLVAIAIVAAMTSGAFVRLAQAIDIGDILKVGGIVLVVSTFGGQINNFINNVLGQRKVASVCATIVVPIFSVGRGASVGAAQVVGVPAYVRHIQGVATVQLSVGNLSGTGLVPISTKSVKGTTLHGGRGSCPATVQACR